MGNTSEKAQGEETRKAMGRRKLLGLAATAAAGLAATQLTGKAHADTGDPLLIGEDNEAGPGYSTVLETNITGTPDPEEYGIGLHVINQGGPDPRTIAIRGEAPNGAGVYGRGGMDGVVGNGDICGVVGKGEGIGVLGISPGVGVKAESGEGTALQAEGRSKFSADVGPAEPDEDRGVVNVVNSSSEEDPRTVAIQANADYGVAVDGRGMTGVVGGGDEYGVVGKARGEGIGVAGFSGAGIGVYAESVVGGSARALRVVGMSSFRTVGSGTIPRRSKSFEVVVPGLVTENSHISVTLTSDPNIRGDAAVLWVKRQPPDSFIINLTERVGKDTTFTYFIVEP